MKKKSYVVSKKFVIYAKKEYSSDDDDGIASDKSYHKIRDHYHYTGKYRGAAHDVFNRTYKTPN